MNPARIARFRRSRPHSGPLALLLALALVPGTGRAQVSGANGANDFTNAPSGPAVFDPIDLSNPAGGGQGSPSGDSGDGGAGDTTGGPGLLPGAPASSAPVIRGGSGRAVAQQPRGGVRGESRTRLGESAGGRAVTSLTSDDWNTWWSSNKFAYIELARVTDLRVDAQGGRLETPSEREMRLAKVRRLVQDDVVPMLRSLTNSPDAQVRAASIVALGKLRDRGSVDIARSLLGDPNFTVRRSAMLSLGVIDRGRASYLLMNVADDSDVGRDLVDSDSISIDDRGTALLTAALRGERFAEPVMIDMLSERDGQPPQMLAMTADAAGLMQSTEALRPLMDIAFDASLPEYVRSSATTALGRIADPTVAPALLQLLESNDLDPKRAAALALGEVTFPGSRTILDRLGARMLSETDAPTRHFLALALGRIGGDQARATLTHALENDPDDDMRPWLALGLGILERNDPDGTAADVLLAALEREDNLSTRGALAIALGLTRGNQVVGPLADLLGTSSSHEIAGHAALALGLSGRPEAMEPLREALETRTNPIVLRQAALALGVLGDGQAIGDLVGLIESTNNPFVASFASIGVAMMGDADAVGPLMRVIEARGPTGVTTTWAVAAIGQLFDQDRRPALARLATGDNYHTRPTAVRDLLSLGF